MTENSKNKCGRPEIELDEIQIRDIEVLAAFLPIEKIANYLGISEKTFRNIKNKNEKVFTAYNKGVAKAHANTGNILMKFMQYDGEDTAQLQLKFQATKFYAQTKAGWGKDDNRLKIDIPTNATPLGILDKALGEIRKGNITLPEIKQLTDLAQLKQQLLSLQPKDDQVEKQYTLEECVEYAKLFTSTTDVIDIMKENEELKKKLEKLGSGYGIKEKATDRMAV